MIKMNLLLTVIACIIICIAIRGVEGKKSYIQRLPNVPANWPAVGHFSPNSNGPLNPFGVDFKNAGKEWTKSLCEKDSDNDGRTYGEELGDPRCVWVPGAIPERTTDITNPGIPDDPPPIVKTKSPTTNEPVVTSSPTLRPTFSPTMDDQTTITDSPTFAEPVTPTPTSYDARTNSPTSFIEPDTPRPTYYLRTSSPTFYMVTNEPTFAKPVTFQPTIPEPTPEPTSEDAPTTLMPSRTPTALPTYTTPMPTYSTLEPTFATEAPTPDDHDYGSYSIPTWLVAHIVLGGLGMGFFMPLGNYFSSFGRKYTQGEWKNVHMILGLASVATSAVAFYLGLTETGANLLDSPHGTSSLVMIVLLGLQTISGLTKKYRIQLLGQVGETHIAARWVAIPTSLAVLISGYRLVPDQFSSPPITLLQFASIHVFVCIVFWLAHFWHHFEKRMKRWRIHRMNRTSPELLGATTSSNMQNSNSATCDVNDDNESRTSHTSSSSVDSTSEDLTQPLIA